MDSWKKHALVSLENELKVNLSMTDLVGRLERPAGGFMTELERKHVEEVQGGSERVGRILGILRGKGNKEFDTFLKMLKESGNEVWADKIQESAQLFEECQKSKGMEFSHCQCPWLDCNFTDLVILLSLFGLRMASCSYNYMYVCITVCALIFVGFNDRGFRGSAAIREYFVREYLDITVNGPTQLEPINDVMRNKNGDNWLRGKLASLVPLFPTRCSCCRQTCLFVLTWYPSARHRSRVGEDCSSINGEGCTARSRDHYARGCSCCKADRWPWGR